MMRRFKYRLLFAAYIFSAAGIGALPLQATENGLSHADLAYIDTMVGVPLSPGLYLRSDINYYRSTRLNDKNGNRVKVAAGALGSFPLKFRSTSVAGVVAAAFVPDATIPVIDATFGMAVYGFYAISDAQAQFTILGGTHGTPETRRGWGDVTVVPAFFQWAFPKVNTYIKLSPLEFTAPTGQYNAKDEIGNNIGLNYWSYRPALLLTYLESQNELSVNFGTSVNSSNPATNYTSGSEIYFTYAMQRHFDPKLALGIEGYYYRQVTDDLQNGVIVNTTSPPDLFHSKDPLNAGPGNRGEAFALGPVVSYQVGPNVFLNAHWVHEIFAFNRKQGDSFWARATIRF